MKINIKNLSIQVAGTSKDTDLLFQFEKRCFNRSFDNVFPSVEKLRDFFADVTAYIAFVNNKPTGYLAYKQINNSEIEVIAIAVFPEYQHQGIASALFEYLFQIENNKKMELVVHPQNSQAIRFYLNNDFLIKAWKDNCFGDKQPRLVLVRETKKLQ